MINKRVNLKQLYPSLYYDVELESFCPDNYDEYSKDRKRKCLIVLPGGGYQFRSHREEQVIAYQFLAADIATFVLDYSIADKVKYPCPMAEVFAAIAYIRKNSDFYHVDPNKISVIGFSAGGHLAASTAAFCHTQEYADFLGVKLQEIELNGCILAYAVISSIFGETTTINTITEKHNPKYEQLFSIDKQVTKDFPKTFIWHTTSDTCVPVENSLCLADALAKNKVFFELHIYPKADHGISIADETVYPDSMDKNYLKEMAYNTQWVKQAIHFIKEYI